MLALNQDTGLYEPADGHLRAIDRMPPPTSPNRQEPTPPSPVLGALHGALRGFVQHDAYPCVGAKSALNTGAYRVGVYPELGSPEAVRQATADIQWFAGVADGIDARFATFLSVFIGVAASNEQEFERRLWKQLQGMHEVDAQRHAWDAAVSPNAQDPEFSFSIGGRAFFLVGMHPAASRIARRFPMTMVVWNLHSQFELLREEGQYERMKTVIRAKDEQLQGPNPELRDHGAESEARQYSGCPHHAGWVAPFSAVESAGHDS